MLPLLEMFVLDQALTSDFRQLCLHGDWVGTPALPDPMEGLFCYVLDKALYQGLSMGREENPYDLQGNLEGVTQIW
jgi:hypothetical protein